MNQAAEIRQWIDFACDSNDLSALKHKIDFEFNARFTRRLGDAKFVKAKQRGKLRLSVPLWQRASEVEKRETVIHETCHIIVDYLFLNSRLGQTVKRPDPHGLEWQHVMRKCGIEPERTHHVDRTGLHRRQKLYIISTCPKSGVEHKCRIRSKTFNRLKRGVVVHCNVCNIDIRYDDIEDDDYETKKVS